MKLRELINRLEQLSHNGKNDNMHVEVWSQTEGDVVDGNDSGYELRAAVINKFVSSNEEYEYIELITE